MARGTPDGRITDNQFAAQVSDVAHVNNMLWGFSPIDGQGRVVYFDTFNNGLGGWITVKSGAAALPVINIPNQFTYSPPAVCLMSPGTVGNDYAYIYRPMFAGKSLRMGIEIGFQFANTTPNLQISIDYRPIGFQPWLGYLTFDHATGTWRVFNSLGAGQIFYTPGTPPGGADNLIQIKVVMDFSMGKYVRAFVGDQDFDISAIGMASSGSSYNGLLIAGVRATSYGAGCTSSNLGYVLITKDEP